jgi:N-formylglutamate deformylase
MEVCIQHVPKGEVVPVVASLPHSGLYVPAEVDRLFTQRRRQWLRNTDWHLPQLYSFLPDLGVTMLEATHSRYVADLNRDPSGDLYGSFARAVVAAATADGAPIYAEPPDPRDLAGRIVSYHAPYHAALRRILAGAVKRFGRALLLDLHSFMGPIDNDICIGDRWGSSCSAGVSASFHDAFNAEGFDVVLNAPFAGGYIVRAYAAPPTVETLQLELRYTNYLDCAKIDEPGLPKLDPLRIAAAQARLRPAMARAIGALKNSFRRAE